MTVRSLVADLVEDVFADAARSDEDPHRLWARVEELGLTLPAVPEALGGAGGAVADELEVLRAAGRHAMPLPLLETGFLAGWLLAGADVPAPPGPMTAAPVAFGERVALRRDRQDWRLAGVVAGVPFAVHAARLVLLATDAAGRAHVAIVPRAACELHAAPTAAGEPRHTVVLDDVALPADAVARSPADGDQLLRRAALGRTVLTLGALETVRDLTVRHVREREQFGRPLSHFQAVQTHVAAIARDVALTESAVAAATEPLRDGAPLPLIEVASAKAVASDAATRVAALAHQVHGAIGVTTEHPLPRFTRRLWAWRDDAGSERMWACALGEALLSGPVGLWGEIAPTAEGDSHA